MPDVTGPGAGRQGHRRGMHRGGLREMGDRPGTSNDFGPLINTGTGAALTDPGGSTANGTPLVTGPDSGDLSGPWRVSFHHYMTG